MAQRRPYPKGAPGKPTVLSACDGEGYGCTIAPSRAKPRKVRADIPGLKYTSSSWDKCPKELPQRCPVALTFKDGKGYFRFCSAPGGKGIMIPFSGDANRATKAIESVCGCWGKSKSKSFEKCKMPALAGTKKAKPKAKRRKRRS